MDVNMDDKMNPNVSGNMNGNVNMNANNRPVKKETPGFISPLVIGLCIIISCAILGGAFLKYKLSDTRTIGATGSASVDFDADLIIWRGSFSATDYSSKDAYSRTGASAPLRWSSARCSP